MKTDSIMTPGDDCYIALFTQGLGKFSIGYLEVYPMTIDLIGW